MNDDFIDQLICAIHKAAGMYCIALCALIAMFAVLFVDLLHRMKFELIAIREILTKIKNAPIKRRDRENK